MKLRRVASLFLASSLCLFVQRANATRTSLPDLTESHATVYDLPAAGTWLIESIHPLGRTDDGSHLDLAVLVAPETHTRALCIVQSPLGLFSWTGFGQGVWDVVTEPFEAVADVGVGIAIGVHNVVSETDIALEDVEFSSILASGTRARRLEGESGLAAVGKGYGQLAVTVGTVGIAPLAQNLGESLGYYVEGDITLEELDYRLSRGAGSATAAAALASGASKATGRGWTGRGTKPAGTGKNLSAAKLPRKSAVRLLVKRGMSPEQARSFVRSFKGEIAVRRAASGEIFLRYTGRAGSRGSFLTKQQFAHPGDAVKGLHLDPKLNPATLRQTVVPKGNPFVMEGAIKGAQPPGIGQSVINPAEFVFSKGVPYGQ